jgi:hypothetical protein
MSMTVSELRNVVTSIKPVLEDELGTARELEMVLYRGTGILRRMSGSETLDAAIGKVQRLAVVIRLAHSAWIAFEAASGPVGWTFAIIAGLSAGLTAADYIVSMGE